MQDHAPPLAGVSVAEFARQIGVCERTGWTLVKSGEVKSAKIGKRRIIPVAEADRFLNSKLAGSEL